MQDPFLVGSRRLLSEAKDKLSVLIDEADRIHEIIHIARHCRAPAKQALINKYEKCRQGTLHVVTMPPGCTRGPYQTAVCGKAVGDFAVRRRS